MVCNIHDAFTVCDLTIAANKSLPLITLIALSLPKHKLTDMHISWLLDDLSQFFKKLNGEYSSQSLEQTMEDKIYGGRPDWAKPGSTQHGYQTQPDTRSYPTESDVRSQPVVSARSASQQGHREFLTRTPIKSDNPLPGNVWYIPTMMST